MHISLVGMYAQYDGGGFQLAALPTDRLIQLAKNEVRVDEGQGPIEPLRPLEVCLAPPERLLDRRLRGGAQKTPVDSGVGR
jgi:hypothetical protein